MTRPSRTPGRRGTEPTLAAALLISSILLGARAASAQDTLVRPLSLGEAARLAARQSALAEAAGFRATEARARARQSRAELLPNLSAAGSQGDRTFNTASFGFTLPGLDPRGEVIGPVRTIDFRGRAEQNLVDVGGIQRWRASQASARAAGADAAATAEQAASVAAGAYLRSLRTEAQLRARAADSALAADLLGIARNQLRAGVGVGLDVTRAEAQVAATRAQLIQARNERDRAQLDLLRSLGLPLDARVRLTDSLSRLSTTASLPSEAAAVDRALRTRPDLRAADAQLRAAERQLGAIRAERLPTLGVYGDQGATGLDYQHLLNTYTWGVQLSVPIFDGFRREARVQEQQALAREVDVRRRDLRQQAAVDVRGALLDLASAREQVDAARERLRLAEQELAQARERFSAGVAGNADVITASLSLNGSRTLLVDALTSYQSARVSLARAEGAVTELP